MTNKYKIVGVLTVLATVVGVFGMVGATQASPSPISVGNQVYADGSSVYIKFLSASAADTDLAILAPVTQTSPTLINNQTTPINNLPISVVGVFTAGEELVFALENTTTGITLFTGSGLLPGISNPDGFVHANVTYEGSGVTQVAFEDLTSQENSDWDYNDLVFDVYGTEGQPSVQSNVGLVPDASTTVSLLGMSLTGLALLARRFKK
jgi:VPDSG-CTERM motif